MVIPSQPQDMPIQCEQAFFPRYFFDRWSADGVLHVLSRTWNESFFGRKWPDTVTPSLYTYLAGYSGETDWLPQIKCVWSCMISMMCRRWFNFRPKRSTLQHANYCHVTAAAGDSCYRCNNVSQAVHGCRRIIGGSAGLDAKLVVLWPTAASSVDHTRCPLSRLAIGAALNSLEAASSLSVSGRRRVWRHGTGHLSWTVTSRLT